MLYYTNRLFILRELIVIWINFTLISLRRRIEHCSSIHKFKQFLSERYYWFAISTFEELFWKCYGHKLNKKTLNHLQFRQLIYNRYKQLRLFSVHSVTNWCELYVKKHLFVVPYENWELTSLIFVKLPIRSAYVFRI